MQWPGGGMRPDGRGFYTDAENPLTPKQSNAVSRPLLRGVGVLALLLILVGEPLYLRTVCQFVPSQRSGLLPRLIGTRAALEGRDPYSAEVVREIQTVFYGHPLAPGDRENPETFLYPATLVPLLAPLAPLSIPAARMAFLAVSVPLLGVAVWLLLGVLPVSLTWRAKTVVLLLTFAAWPTLWGFRMLQMTMIIAALVWLSWYLLTRGYRVMPGVLLALTSVKPQLVLALLAVLLVWAVLRRQWTLIASAVAALGVLLGVTEMLVPHWFGHWRASLRNYTDITGTAAPLEHLLGHGAGLAVTIAIACVAVVAIRRLREYETESTEFAQALSLILAVTVCFIPTDGALVYNYLLVMPACVVLIFSRPAGAIAPVLRLLMLVQLGVDFLSVTLAGVWSLTGHIPDLLAFVTLSDYLLPPLAAAALAAQMLERRRVPASVSAEAVHA